MFSPLVKPCEKKKLTCGLWLSHVVLGGYHPLLNEIAGESRVVAVEEHPRLSSYVSGYGGVP
jgi:hypothetical protein